MVGTQVLSYDPLLAAYPWLGVVYAVIGVAVFVILLCITIYFLKNLRQTGMDDLPKFLWAISFFVFPVISWIAYYVVVMKA